MDKPIRIYQCENTVNGILTAIYDAGVSGYGHQYIRIQPVIEREPENLELFSEYRSVQTDPQKAENVMKTVRERISRQAYQYMMYAVVSCFPDRGDALYQFISYGFTMGHPVCSALQLPCVKRVFEIKRSVGNEVHFYKEFLRFQEIRQNPSILYAIIEPKHRILPMLTEHFADRFMNEWFVIYDQTNGEATFHYADGTWDLHFLTPEQEQQLCALQERKEEYVDLWKTFFHHIAVTERTNPNLQRNMLPLHYRKHMTEFQ